MSVAAVSPDRAIAGRSAILVPLRSSLPLLVVCAALFTAGYLCWLFGIRLGPGAFSLWALFLVLGFVAAIGTTISWFYADEEIARAAVSPEAEEPAEFGRPRPDVRVAPVSEPWFEGLPVEVSAPVSRSRSMSPVDVEMGRALDEIDRIANEVSSRRKRDAPDAR
jgi:hypothetical protein